VRAPTTPRRIGLVLGAGGAVGHAYHSGVLAGLAEATGWDPRDAEIVVGTSAGSVVGALLRAGVSAPDLAAHSTDGELSEEGARI
jgi:NTE family protein